MKVVPTNESVQIKEDKKALYKVTTFELTGSTLTIEGYAMIEQLSTNQEDRIRKSIILTLKNLDEDTTCLQPILIPLENCMLFELSNKPEWEEMKDYETSLAGFKGHIELTSLFNNRCLPNGAYEVYLKLEQFPEHSDAFKYEKILPLWHLKDKLKEKHYAVKLAEESTHEVSKYNFIVTFDHYKKTIVFKNTLIQHYNPRQFSSYQKKEKTNAKTEAFKRRFFKLMYIFFCLLPINKKKIVFASDSRDELNGNLFFIYEELQKRERRLSYKFLLHKTIKQKKSLFKLTTMAYHLARAKIILIDDFYPLIYPLKIRKHADLIQTWHAAGAFKTFGFSRLGRPGGPAVWSRNHRNYTKVAVSSEDVRKHYAEGFGINIENVYATGVPRSDIFFDEAYKSYVKETFYKNYPQLKGKKVILFAPTFRGNGQSTAHYPFDKLNLTSIYEKLNKDYVFLFKMHPFVQNKLDIPKEYASFYYDFSHIREINDLLLVTDHLITDYSSVCFEYALLQKPMTFFAFDVEEYIEERDFYYDYYDFIPGPLVKYTDDLIQAIKNDTVHTEKLNDFVKKFFHDDLGNASKRVVNDLIIPSLEGQNKTEKQEKKKWSIPSSRKELFELSMDKKEQEKEANLH